MLSQASPETTDRQQGTRVVKLAVVGKPVFTDRISLEGERFQPIEKKAGEGNTFLVVNLALTFSGAPAILFFDQIALLDGQDRRIPPSYFSVSYNFKLLKSELPFNAVGEGSGTFYRQDGEALKEAFAYLAERSADNGQDRWGLRYAAPTANTVWVFLLSKGQKGKGITVGDQKVILPAR